ncbi:membrane fusion protein (multidrug efflux system) [Anseongella ginsenosidimutans]|uniref:Membrane fusion protein (Multidrug efflux system) n=1 Tax=Anseongella ginsenosidimutans TaxID=496056 RepID=A0A4R3KVA8_9SPHI|nr:efflux RND transporter periplasmic adaptor subunit [Anseongella ginsenosidimutans]QEC51725.1 efflux RND transporter periplasmic adaptor subunit [Anseongella ginsenosidimutans]TCS89088.1 membrane fusion protein (multidrug efflux system) [Anseongella ginsenosidimutans]
MNNLIHTATKNKGRRTYLPLFFILLSFVFLQACSTSTGSENPAAAPQSLPVITLSSQPVTTYQEFSATLEGSKDIEIRPQVDGQLTEIYVDEGDLVKEGQRLFKINDREYTQQFNNAKASVAAAKANLAYAEIEVAKLSPLVANKVISEVQLKSAKAAQLAAEANVAQAEAMLESARINLDYTVVRAPAEGYIGRIPFKTGSLVNPSNPQALTVLSEIKNVFVYFSMSESEFLRFKEEASGNSVIEKIDSLPPVELVLADGSFYPKKGKVELVSGQFDNSMGAITFRAVFPNADRLLRSGSTGRIRIPRIRTAALTVPQEATFNLQDKIFVFAVGSDNKVVSKPLTISGKSGTSYLVESGLSPGDKIVYSGLDRLQDGSAITPMFVSIDSLKTIGSL